MRSCRIAEDALRHLGQPSKTDGAVRLLRREAGLRLLAPGVGPARHHQVEKLVAAETVIEQIVQYREIRRIAVCGLADLALDDVGEVQRMAGCGALGKAGPTPSSVAGAPGEIFLTARAVDRGRFLGWATLATFGLLRCQLPIK